MRGERGGLGPPRHETKQERDAERAEARAPRAQLRPEAVLVVALRAGGMKELVALLIVGFLKAGEALVAGGE